MNSFWWNGRYLSRDWFWKWQALYKDLIYKTLFGTPNFSHVEVLLYFSSFIDTVESLYYVHLYYGHSPDKSQKSPWFSFLNSYFRSIKICQLRPFFWVPRMALIEGFYWITFKSHNYNHKVLNNLYVKFHEQILNFVMEKQEDNNWIEIVKSNEAENANVGLELKTI